MSWIGDLLADDLLLFFKQGKSLLKSNLISNLNHTFIILERNL